jgi:RNA polymerase sigma-70 factor (ECF subfamily)
LFLARLVTELLPQDPESLGLLALMLYSEARRAARRGPHGDYVPLAQQNLDQWDRQMIDEAENLVRLAASLARPGRYQIEAALQSAHVHRCSAGTNNWREVVDLYDVLLALTNSPVVQLNRALAVAERDGAQAGLAAMPDAARLGEYQPYWAARAELLARTGDRAEAYEAYEMAIGLERDAAVRRFLQGKQQSLKD